MKNKLFNRFLVAFLMVLIVASISTAGNNKKDYTKQIIGQVFKINDEEESLILFCGGVNYTITCKNRNNVELGDWVIAKVDDENVAYPMTGRQKKISPCGERALIETSEIKKVFVKDDILYITNANGSKKRLEIDQWTSSTSPDKTYIVYTVGFYYYGEALILIADKKGLVKHTLDVSDESGMRWSNGNIKWINDKLFMIGGNINYATDQYLLFSAKTGILLRSYLASDCALSWSPAKDKIALCGWYSPSTPEEYRGDDLRIDEKPTVLPKGVDALDVITQLVSIYPSESEQKKDETEHIIHKFLTNFQWSPNGKFIAFIDELQQVGQNDENNKLGRSLIIVNVIEKTATKIALTESATKSIGWSKDSRFVLLNNLSFDTSDGTVSKRGKNNRTKRHK